VHCVKWVGKGVENRPYKHILAAREQNEIDQNEEEVGNSTYVLMTFLSHQVVQIRQSNPALAPGLDRIWGRPSPVLIVYGSSPREEMEAFDEEAAMIGAMGWGESDRVGVKSAHHSFKFQVTPPSHHCSMQ